jgi:hypothetical protein
MATTSFNKKQDTSATETTVTRHAVIATETEHAPAVIPHQDHDDVEGEITRADIRLPRLNIVQKVGDLSNIFTPGDILFNKELVLADGKKPIPVTVLRLKKMYQEKIPYGESEEMPVAYETAQEVIDAGGSLRYGDTNYYAEIAHCMVAIRKPAEECPEDLAALFPYEFEDQAYGLAMWTLTGSAFTAAGKTLITASQTVLKNGGLCSGRWDLTTELKKNAKNSWFAPKLKFAAKHTPEATAFFQSLK